MSELIGSLAEMGYSLNEAQALERELTRGWNMRAVTEKTREIAAAKEADKLRGNCRSLPGLGLPVLSIDQQQYEEVVDRYGYDCFGDRGFVRDFQRWAPECKIYSA